MVYVHRVEDIGQGGTGEIGSVGWVGGRSGLQGNIEWEGRGEGHEEGGWRPARRGRRGLPSRNGLPCRVPYLLACLPLAARLWRMS